MPGRCSHAGDIPADGRLLIGPRWRDHPLAAIGQDHQQLHGPGPAQLTQHPDGLPLQRVPVPGHPHLQGQPHYRSPPKAAACKLPVSLHACTSLFRIAYERNPPVQPGLLPRDLSKRGLSVRELPPAAI